MPHVVESSVHQIRPGSNTLPERLEVGEMGVSAPRD
jgi:hypothetical protein